MENTFVLAFLFLFHFSPGGTYETYCSSGERLHTPREGHDVCIPCQYGTFIEDDHHFFRQCKPCKVIENSDVEVLVSACNSSHDAGILCKGGFYRRRARNIRQKDRCEKCTECPFPAQPCEGFYNTVCCPPNHDAVMTPDGVFVCNERPIVCGAGQFFRTSSEECLPCQAGTFMSDHSHTYKDCLKCEELSENNLTHAVITRPCSRTAPTLFGCKAGYFRDPTQESLQIEVPCKPCRICNRILVDCHMFHDAVCDDEDRMVSTATTNLTVSVGTSEVVDKMKQLKTTFNESVHSCILRCLQATIAQSEYGKRECLWSCFLEINELYEVSEWLRFCFHIVLFVLISCVILLIPKLLDLDNPKNSIVQQKPKNEKSPTSQLTSPRRSGRLVLMLDMMFVANVVGIILFILLTLLKISVIEDRGYGVAVIPVCCFVVFTLNVALLLILILCKKRKT